MGLAFNILFVILFFGVPLYMWYSRHRFSHAKIPGWDKAMIEGKRSYDRKDFANAKASFHKAWSLADRDGLTDEQKVDSISWYTNCCIAMREHDDTFTALTKGLELAEKLDHPDARLLAADYAKLAIAGCETGRFHEAEIAAGRGAEIASQQDPVNERGLFLNLIALIRTCLHQNKYREAEEACTRALSLDTQSGQRVAIAEVTGNLAVAYFKQGKCEEAEKSAVDHISLLEDIHGINGGGSAILPALQLHNDILEHTGRHAEAWKVKARIDMLSHEERPESEN